MANYIPIQCGNTVRVIQEPTAPSEDGLSSDERFLMAIAAERDALAAKLRDLTEAVRCIRDTTHTKSAHGPCVVLPNGTNAILAGFCDAALRNESEGGE